MTSPIGLVHARSLGWVGVVAASGGGVARGGDCRAVGHRSRGSRACAGGRARAGRGSAADGPELVMAVWVPDPATGEAWGDMVLEYGAAEPGNPVTATSALARARKAPKIRGVKIVSYAVVPELISIPAGRRSCS